MGMKSGRSAAGGLGGWVAIFKGGRQVDSNGAEHDGTAMLDKAVSTFNAAAHEPPVVVGHPRDNAPAFGWVEGLKKDGDTLYAKFKQVVPEFADMVRQGLFKKRSASFYADGRLRHVGFLGAAPPAIKGLPEIAFKDTSGGPTFEFCDEDDGKFSRLGGILRSLREWMIEKFGQEQADKIVSNYDIDALEQPTPAEPSEAAGAFTEPSKQEKTEMGITQEELEAAKRAAAEDSRKKVEAEFSEKLAVAQKENAALSAQIAKEKDDRRKAGNRDFVEGLKKEGKFLPAWEKAGVLNFMDSLPADEPVNFSEAKAGDPLSKETSLDFMKRFLSGLPQSINFGEISAEAGGHEPTVDQERDKLVKNFMESNKADIKTAMIEVSRKRPDLFPRLTA